MTRRIARPATLSPRAREIVATARTILEEGGADALSLRTLAARMGIRAPSLYNHFPDKASLEAALIASGLVELALVLETASREQADPRASVARAYRSYALRHPHLYRLITGGPLPPELPGTMAVRVQAPFLAASGGDPARATALRAFAHGMVELELNGITGSADEPERAWRVGLP